MTPPSGDGRTAGPVVAIVPAKDRADRIAGTLVALAAVPGLDRIVVVDDGSTDDTAALAAAALPPGSGPAVEVLRLARNRGKGGAVAVGIAAAPDAGVYLLIDADLGVTAADAARAVLAPVAAGDADMAIAVPESAGRRAGFGKVRDLAAAGIRRATGFVTTAPLSGQRAVRGPLLRSLPLADRFGLETALTIDAVRAGARVVEVPVAFEHRHTGRSLAGFAHRARQGADIARALSSRLTTTRGRKALIGVLTVLIAVVGLWSGAQAEPSSVAGTRTASRVVVFGLPRLSLDDVGTAAMPTLDRLVREGALAATSVRTLSARPSTVEAYTTLGAGARVRARDPAADAAAPSAPIDGVPAGAAARLRTGVEPSGQVVVVGAAATRLINEDSFVPSLPGALGDALRAAGKRTAVVGNTDIGDVEADVEAGFQRPAAAAVMDANGVVDVGDVGTGLLKADPAAPFGIVVDDDRFVAAATDALQRADVVVLDPGELDRAAILKAYATEEQAERVRLAAMARTDALLGRVVDALPADALLLAVALRPETSTWELTPTVAWGAGVRHGYLHSSSTKRLGLVTLTDLAPTILDAVGVEVPSDMIGHPLRYHPGEPDLERLRSTNSLAGFRERLYLPLTKGYVTAQAILYLFVILWFSARGGVGRGDRLVTWLALAIAGLPLATFVLRVIPHVWSVGAFGIPVVLAIDAVLVALVLRARRHVLSPLSWMLALTAAVIVVDVFTGARLQQSSVLGYSPHTAARFTGVGNTAFAVLAATTTLWAAIHVQYAPRRREALLTAAAVCAVVVVVDGAPVLGADVGGILTLVPVFGLLLAVLSGRRITRRLVGAAAAVTVAALAVATAVDLARSPDARSHLGQFVSSDESGILNTIGRKATTNLRVFSGSFWTWIVPVIAAVTLYLLVWRRGWERDVPPGSALRAGAVASLVAGLVGFAVNDSGVVVTALVYVFLGPYLVLLALARDDGPVRVAPPAGDGGSGAGERRLASAERTPAPASAPA